jgi:hypothetical protein
LKCFNLGQKLLNAVMTPSPLIAQGRTCGLASAHTKAGGSGERVKKNLAARGMRALQRRGKFVIDA